MMKSLNIALQFCLALAIPVCSFVVTPSTQAQIPGYLQRELDNVGRLSEEASREIERIQPEVQRQQQYEAQLWTACMNGNNISCQEYQSIQERRTPWIEQNDCRYRTGLNRC